MNSFNWFAELQVLAARHSRFGITADLANLTIAEAYALLAWLRRLAGE